MNIKDALHEIEHIINNNTISDWQKLVLINDSTQSFILNNRVDL